MPNRHRKRRRLEDRQEEWRSGPSSAVPLPTGAVSQPLVYDPRIDPPAWAKDRIAPPSVRPAEPVYSDLLAPKGQFTQVKYGPGEGLRDRDNPRIPGGQILLNDHLYDSSGNAGGIVSTRKRKAGAATQKPPKKKARFETVAEKRLTRYSPNHEEYVEEAKAAGRPFTLQESRVDQALNQPAPSAAPRRRVKAPPANARKKSPAKSANDKSGSINHVIASGVGQNTLNAGIIASLDAHQQFLTGMSGLAATSAAPGGPAADGHRQTVRSALASQAAGVGRMQMYNRAIVDEQARITPRDAAGMQMSRSQTRHPESPEALAQAKLTDRNALLKKTIRVMSSNNADIVPAVKRVAPARPFVSPSASGGPTTLQPRPAPSIVQNTQPGLLPANTKESSWNDYESILKETFDSPANLRVGDAKLNLQVLTGLDEELDSTGRPTERSRRLAQAHDAAKPDFDEKVHTTNSGGQRLTSSRQVGAATRPAKVTASYPNPVAIMQQFAQEQAGDLFPGTGSMQEQFRADRQARLDTGRTDGATGGGELRRPTSDFATKETFGMPRDKSKLFGGALRPVPARPPARPNKRKREDDDIGDEAEQETLMDRWQLRDALHPAAAATDQPMTAVPVPTEDTYDVDAEFTLEGEEDDEA